MRLTPLENEYSLVTILDVTEEKKAEELLRQTTSELSAVIDAFPDLFLRLNADGTIIDYRMGRAAEAPYAPQHLLGRRIQDLLPGQIGPALLDAVQQVLRTETPVIREFTLQPGDGQRHYEIRIVPLYEKYLLAIMREITERVLTEQELQTYRDGLERLVRERTTELERANHQLRRLLYYVEMTERKAAKEWLTCSADPEKEGVYPADEGIVTTDAEGRIILANYAAEQYIGYDSSEMAGKPIWSFCSAGASGDYPLPGFFSDVLEAGRQNAVEDAVLFRKDGAQRPIRLLGEPIRDENDAVIGMICTFHLA
jgi:PAS domain S-box-containing protein